MVAALWKAAAALLVTTGCLVAAPGVALAANVCQNPPAPTSDIPGVPYEDKLYEPARLAPLATGRGVRVAVIDSGGGATQPQLRGPGLAGEDPLYHDANGQQDCVGHGTEVSSLIAGQPLPGIGMQGLAPGADIVPIRVSEQEDDANGSGSGNSGGRGGVAQRGWPGGVRAGDPVGGRSARWRRQGAQSVVGDDPGRPSRAGGGGG